MRIRNFGNFVTVEEEQGCPTLIHASQNIYRRKYKKLGVGSTSRKNGKDFLRLYTYDFSKIEDRKKRDKLMADFVSEVQREFIILKDK